MKQKNLELKLRVSSDSLYVILLERIASCKKPNEEIVKFPALFSKVASSFSIPKEKVWPLLYFLHDLNFITIIFGHGVKINYGVKNENK